MPAPRSKRRYTPSPPPSSTPSTTYDEVLGIPLHRSAKLSDRASVFQAIYCPSVEDPRTLQRLPEFSTATHKILAWRMPGRQRNLNLGGNVGGQVGRRTEKVLDTGYDDDGEKYAGKKVLAVLETEKVTGVIVVARWYGGVMLGPVRFKWIEDCAQTAVQEFRSGSVGSTKKVKTEVPEETDSRKREEIEAILKQRDESIRVLRALLRTKKGEAEAANTPERSGPIYGNMKIDVLRKLESARDKTIAWLLDEIAKAETNAARASVEHGDILARPDAATGVEDR